MQKSHITRVIIVLVLSFLSFYHFSVCKLPADGAAVYQMFYHDPSLTLQHEGGCVVVERYFCGHVILGQTV